MTHLVLGMGGIGALVGAALARSGQHVALLGRALTVDSWPAQTRVESSVLGEFFVALPAIAEVTEPLTDADVAWIAVKATGLDEALGMLPPRLVGSALVIPLLNGIDHLSALRDRYDRVAAGTIRVESERVAPGHIVQPSSFARAQLAPPPRASAGVSVKTVAEQLTAAGIATTVRPDEAGLLWDKLVFLGPTALATSAYAAPVGEIRDRADYLACLDEAIAVAQAEGVEPDVEGVRATIARAQPEMRSSMQKDLEAGREPELDAIAGPILRGGKAHGIPTPATADLVRRIRERADA